MGMQKWATSRWEVEKNGYTEYKGTKLNTNKIRCHKMIHQQLCNDGWAVLKKKHVPLSCKLAYLIKYYAS